MSFSSVIADLEAEAKGAIANFVGGVEAVAEKIAPVVVQDVEDFLRQLGSIALGAVMNELPKAISGNEKFGSAVSNVIQTVEAQGKPIAVQDAQQAVQNAFRALQSAVSSPAA